MVFNKKQKMYLTKKGRSNGRPFHFTCNKFLASRSE